MKILSEYFGQMPCIGCAGHYAGTGTWCNGGIPQLANKTAHVDAMEQDMKTAIPDEDFDGYIVHDWEAWEGTWGYASDEYRNASVALARSQNPGSSEAALEKIASAAYTKASVELLALTAKTSKRLRPKAKVGFYGLPVRAPKPPADLADPSPTAAASPACALARDVLLRTAHEGLAPPGRSTSSTGRSRS